MLLSIVIPTFSCESTIDRLLRSIYDNHLNKDDYEVIIADDHSADTTLEIVDTYIGDLPIKVVTVPDDMVSCPGTTRQIGLEAVSAKYVTFVDHDDTLTLDLAKAVDYLRDNDVKYGLSTGFNRNDSETLEIKKVYGSDAAGRTWLHGKFYNVDFIRQNNICFKSDLKSHEDVYFNMLFVTKMISIGIEEDFEDSELITYNWIENDNSTSSKGYSANSTYIDNNFFDYIVASTEPYLQLGEVAAREEDKELKSKCYQSIIMNFLHGYFYYESDRYRNGGNHHNNLEYLNNCRKAIKTVFDVTDDDIINIVYNSPQVYNDIKNDCFMAVGAFVETQSFRDFIYNL